MPKHPCTLFFLPEFEAPKLWEFRGSVGISSLYFGNTYVHVFGPTVVERAEKRELTNMTDSPIQLSPESEPESKCAYELRRDQNVARMAVALEPVLGAAKAL